jgi:4-hydroxy-tetrahydrodipicolinate synthase
MNTPLAGTYTAIVTPFNRKGRVDEKKLAELVEFQIKNGIDGIVPVGTTGESPTLSHAEHIRVIEVAVKAAKQRCHIMAGTGSNSTDEAISLTRKAEKVGADSCLLVSPYYNKPTQEGLYQHFKAIAKCTRLPLVLYSIPGRCGIEIGVETMRRLHTDCKNIVGVKEAGGTPDRVSQLRLACGENFLILSGDDSMTLPFMSVGAEGVISVATNVIPKQVSTMVRCSLSGKVDEAQALHLKLYPLFKDLFVETNPIPVKAAMAMLGMIEEIYRLPLCRISEKNREVLRAAMQKAGMRT